MLFPKLTCEKGQRRPRLNAPEAHKYVSLISAKYLTGQESGEARRRGSRY